MPEALNSGIELHDSVVVSVAQSGDVIHLTLSPAYIHKSIGKPGIDAGSIFLQDLVLEFQCGRIGGEIGDLPADISDGDFQMGSQIFPNWISLPCEVAGPVSLRLSLLSSDYREIAISGSGMKVVPLREGVYLEEFRP
jgi:hypothetical protein